MSSAQPPPGAGPISSCPAVTGRMVKSCPLQMPVQSCPLKPLHPSSFGLWRISFPGLHLQKDLVQKEIRVFATLILQLAGHPPVTHHCLSEAHAKKQLAAVWTPDHEKQKEDSQQVSSFLGSKK